MYINKLNEFMLKNLPKLSVNILILKLIKYFKRCINSIDKSIPINIENSENFDHSKYFKRLEKM